VIKILTDENLAKKMGEQGKEGVEKEFKWEEQVEKLEKILS
jgi:glycosyltransferase involved in cell wall biosynthesis